MRIKKLQCLGGDQLMNRCAVNGRVVQASRREFGFTFFVTFIQEYLVPDRTRKYP